MDIVNFWAIAGFLLASYSVIANDSIQTLGTFIASNRESIHWKILWLFGASIFSIVVVYGWLTYGGDISYGRLTRIDYIEPQWYHAVAPAILLILTRFGVPVSTTFLVFSVFASSVILEKVLIKSVVGYSVAAVSAYLIWIVISSFIDEKEDKVRPENIKYWRVAQWTTSAYLWFAWLQHDLANIAVYLPRQLSLPLLIGVVLIGICFLGFIFYSGGGRIQKIVLNKTGSRYLRSTSIIDVIYATILFFFKELNDLPMSTTWVFVGLLSGRELAMSTTRKDYKLKYIFPIVAKDFGRLLLGLGISVLIVFGVLFLQGNGY
jgi:phosphate/sulfate permease|tara:strand:- start:1474 stop:2433 length:960 start_codon:yes stop_codon:yes gene_type:complete